MSGLISITVDEGTSMLLLDGATVFYGKGSWRCSRVWFDQLSIHVDITPEAAERIARLALAGLNFRRPAMKAAA